MNPKMDDLGKKLSQIDDESVMRMLRQSHRLNAKLQGVSKMQGKDSPDFGESYSPQEDALLGTMPDGKVAGILGRTAASVRNRRIRLGIELQHRVRRDWTAGEDALLGKHTDSEVARRLNRTYGSVQSRRLALKISCANPQFTRWTAEEDGWLSVVPDEIISQRTKRSLCSIERRKRKLFPEKYKSTKGAPFWSKAEIRLLGTMTDRELAKKLGRTYRSVEVKRRKMGISVMAIRPQFKWTAQRNKMLLTHSDRHLAHLWKCSAKILRCQRRALGIPAIKKDKAWTQREDRLLWLYGNRDAAKRTGRTAGAVNARRSLLGAPDSRQFPRRRKGNPRAWA